jgi:ferredoxin
MKVKIDAEACTGCGLCEENCPDVFELDGDVASVKVSAVPEDQEEAVQECADDCPAEAIIIS